MESRHVPTGRSTQHRLQNFRHRGSCTERMDSRIFGTHYQSLPRQIRSRPSDVWRRLAGLLAGSPIRRMGERLKGSRFKQTRRRETEIVLSKRHSHLPIGLNKRKIKAECAPHWKGAGVVERGALEKRCASNRTGGSNPSPSAIFLNPF